MSTGLQYELNTLELDDFITSNEVYKDWPAYTSLDKPSTLVSGTQSSDKSHKSQWF